MSNRGQRDRRPGGLFPAPIDLTKRRAVENDKTPWTPEQTHVVFQTVAACDSRAAYMRAASPLLEVVGRPPRFAPSARPTADQRGAEADKNIRRHIENGIIQGRKALDSAAFTLSGYRDGLPLTWGERVRVFRPYHVAFVKGTLEVSLLQLARMVGRLDLGPIEAYLETLVRVRLRDEPERSQRVAPFMDSRSRQVLTRIYGRMTAARTAGDNGRLAELAHEMARTLNNARG